MLLRSAVEKQKACRSALLAECKRLVQESEDESIRSSTPAVVATYVKLSQLMRDIEQSMEEWKQEDLDDWRQAQELGRRSLEACEELEGFLPKDHPLKTRIPPMHLAHLMKNPLSESTPSRVKQTNGKGCALQMFSGKGKSTWLIWKMAFEREVHGNEEMSDEDKFLSLLSALKPGSPAFQQAACFAGVPGAFKLAWESLTNRYGDTAQLIQTHKKALREIPVRYRVKQETMGKDLDVLQREIRSHVSSLKALSVEENSFVGWALLALEEALPVSLRVQYFREKNNWKVLVSDADQLDKALQFVENEANVRQQASSISASRIFHEKRPIGFEKRVADKKSNVRESSHNQLSSEGFQKRNKRLGRTATEKSAVCLQEDFDKINLNE